MLGIGMRIGIVESPELGEDRPFHWGDRAGKSADLLTPSEPDAGSSAPDGNI